MNEPAKSAKDKFLDIISNYIKAIWIFFPGIIFLILALFIFLKLDQGPDILFQSIDTPNSYLTGLYLVLATLFYVFTTWYTARIIGYARNDLYLKAKAVLYQFPRLLAFTIFLVLWLAVFKAFYKETLDKTWLIFFIWMAVAIDYNLFFLLYHFIEKPLLKIKSTLSELQYKKMQRNRHFAWSVIIACCIAIITGWGQKSIKVLLFTLPLIQISFLYLLLIRYPLFRFESPGGDPLQERAEQFAKKGFWNWYYTSVFHKPFEGFRYSFEKKLFNAYHVLALAAVICYGLSVFHLPFARALTSLPFIMLAFGIILGIINLISLISHRRDINFFFLIFVVILLGGWLFESHRIRSLRLPDSTRKVYAARDSFLVYLNKWITWHKDSLDKYDSNYAVYFTLADGGASRSGYWVASVLAELHEKTRYSSADYHSYFMDRTICLSGASGGSVGNASFLAAYAAQQKNTGLHTGEMCRNYLANDFLVYPLAFLLGPDLIKAPFGSLWMDRAGALEWGMEHPADENDPIAPFMRNSFSGMLPDDNNRLPVLSINTTRVNDGSPGVISTIDIDKPKAVFGERIDVLNLLGEGEDIRLSTAMALGARFPYMSPGGKLGRNSYFVDGGYFDNSGAGIVHEMLLELASLQKDATDTTLRKYLRKMDFYVIHISNTPNANPEARGKNKINTVINDLATPILTLAGSYSSQTNINDARLSNYLKDLNGGNKSYLTFNLYKEDTIESFPMNWVISQRALNYMNSSLQNQQGLRRLIDDINGGQTKNLFKNIATDQTKSMY